jgi:hypothetical protein
VYNNQEGRCYYCGITIVPPDRLRIESPVCCVCSFELCVGDGSPYTSEYCIRGNLDHKIPVSKGGTYDEENLAWACTFCNHWKRTMTAEEFGDWHGVPLYEREARINDLHEEQDEQSEAYQRLWGLASRPETPGSDLRAARRRLEGVSSYE